MFTTGSKWFLGLGLVSLVLAAAYGWATGGTDLGPITVGYWGGVGDHLGYSMLVSISVLATVLGCVTIASRDADPRALAELAGTDEPPEVVPPAHVAYWPAIGALGVALMVLGLVVSNVLFIASFFLLLAVVVEWMVLAWSDRATGDPETNRLVRNRLLGPYETPLVGVLLAGGTVAALSRLFLTSSKEGAVWVATGFGAAIFILGAVLATKPKIPANLVAGLLVAVSLGVVSAGVIAADRGERVIHPHSEEHEGTSAEDEGTHLQPNIPAGTQHATTTTEAAG